MSQQNQKTLRDVIKSCWAAASGESSCCDADMTQSCCSPEGAADEAGGTCGQTDAARAPTPDEVREAVRDRYARISATGRSCCEAGAAPSCCEQDVTAMGSSGKLGYSREDLSDLPEGADMGLGCGNPGAIASLKPGETVVDLGSGGGIDCFLAAKQVGGTGRVIGVDMTPEMITKARANAEKGGYGNVEFRLGEIEHLPAGDGTADVVMSNCVINLSPDKPAVYQDAFRVLKPGGRLAISDIVRTADLPGQIRNDLAMIGGCVAGASSVGEIEAMLGEAGFGDIRVQPKEQSREVIRDWFEGGGIEDYIVSATIEAVKPLAP